MTLPRPEVEFQGNDRFEIRRRIGQGGMASVYEAWDARRGVLVALKTLAHTEARALSRFKQEFRALADVAHPNLVTLHELHVDEGQWFITMELVDGVDLYDHVAAASVPRERPGSLHTQDLVGPDVLDALARPEAALGLADPGALDQAFDRALTAAPDLERLRPILIQLAAGVNALHAAGILHRDLKPSNVMVTPEGRVVILDFGVIAELAGGRARGESSEVVGTPAYMAPEQWKGEASFASDWYSVGTMLYQVLTGRVPFAGTTAAMLAARQQMDGPAPSTRRADVPEDLDRLCADLLRKDPAARPSGREVLQRLAGREAGVVPAGDRDDAFVGRTAQLHALRRAFAAARSGATQTVVVRGESGIGKSALVRHFLDELAAVPDTVTLTGRCYERESVPYKGMDSVIDALTTYLLGLPEAEVAMLIPRDSAALARVFPVLRRVPALARSRPAGAGDAGELHELRRRAFTALRGLFIRLAQTRTVVIFIDDLQWSDADSAALLEAFLRPPEAPALLLVVAWRGDEASRPVSLASLGPDPAVLELTPLPPSEALLLARRRLAARGGAASTAAQVALESGGHPYFIAELAEAPGAAGATVETAIAARAAALPPAARILLELAAVAARPLPHVALGRATHLPANAFLGALAALRAARLVRSGADERVECYHDRIRETVARGLAPEVRRDHHRALAEGLLASGHADPMELVEHFRGAGFIEAAAESLAFDRAAVLYRLALETPPGVAAEAHALRVGLADALAHAGRGASAAGAYLDAAEKAEGAQAVDLRRRAAEQYLRSGYIDAGLAAMRDVLADARIAMPGSSAAAVTAMLVARARLYVRGLALAPRPERGLPAAALARADAYFGAASGLSMVDPGRAAAFSARGVLHALALGDARLASRALSIEGCFRASLGTRGAARTAVVFDAARRLAEASGDVHAQVLERGCRVFVAYQRGLFREAHEQAGRVLVELRERCRGVAWELGALQIFSLLSLINLGQFALAKPLAKTYLAEADERDDRHTSTNLRALVLPMVSIADDETDEGRRVAAAAIAAWSTTGFYQQHYMGAYASIMADCYDGRAEAAVVGLASLQVGLSSSLLMHAQVVRGSFFDTRARTMLHAAAAGGAAGAPHECLGVAASVVRRLRREGAPWCDALAALNEAGVLMARGQREAALVAYTRAGEALESIGLVVHAASSRWRQGELEGGEGGVQRVAQARTALVAYGVRKPEKVVALLAPTPLT